MGASGYRFGYCTNVHAGASLQQMRANLQQHALSVKQRYCPQQPLGIGLWLSAQAARELLATGQHHALGEWLTEAGLVPYTFNGFPYGDFHQPVVKHAVYEPAWWEPQRLSYTMQLAEIQDALLPPGMEGSISTLPIAWGTPCPDRSQLEQAAAQLRQCAAWLHRLEEETGRLIYVCLEPEPGCVFSFADDAVHFFQWQLLSGPDAEVLRRHIRLCHDVCHAAVMFEDQAEVLRRYAAAGIEVGKIQISSALRLNLDLWEPPADEDRTAALAELAAFAEDRYLHQTVVRRDGQDLFYEDLPPALEAEAVHRRGEWRVHFHVPIHLDQWGRLAATQEQIPACLAAAARYTACRHFEVETYAWGVLPAALQPADLAEGIAQELAWLDRQWSAAGLPLPPA